MLPGGGKKSPLGSAAWLRKKEVGQDITKRAETQGEYINMRDGETRGTT